MYRRQMTRLLGLIVLTAAGLSGGAIAAPTAHAVDQSPWCNSPYGMQRPGCGPAKREPKHTPCYYKDWRHRNQPCADYPQSQPVRPLDNKKKVTIPR
jgi:hypothetical protein